MERKLIVTRHEGLVEWLRRKGIVGEVIAHALPEDVEGRHVVGVLPLPLAARAASVTVVEMEVPFEKRGADLSPEEMDAFGASMRTFTVREGVLPDRDRVEAILEEMAADEWAATAPGWADYECVYCGSGMARGHLETCPVTRARKLLAEWRKEVKEVKG